MTFPTDCTRRASAARSAWRGDARRASKSRAGRGAGVGPTAFPPRGGRGAARAEQEAAEDVGGPVGAQNDAGPADEDHADDGERVQAAAHGRAPTLATGEVDQQDRERRRRRRVAAREAEREPARARTAD